MLRELNLSVCLSVCLSHFYRPQTKFARVMFSQVSVCPGGTHTPPDQRKTPPPRQTPPGRHPPDRHPPGSACWDTVNKRAVRILLECNLVHVCFCIYTYCTSYHSNSCRVTREAHSCVKFQVLGRRSGSCSASPRGANSVALRRDLVYSPASSDIYPGFKTS